MIERTFFYENKLVSGPVKSSELCYVYLCYYFVFPVLFW